jgi:hypothetical protein
MARPSKLTPEVRERIVQAILAGNYFETACQFAGVATATGYEWLARGEGRDQRRPRNREFAEFAEAVGQAEAQAEVHTVALIRQGLPDNPRLALDFLARRYPDRWGGRDSLHVTHDLDGAIRAELARLAGPGQARLAGAAPVDANGALDGGAGSP